MFLMSMSKQLSRQEMHQMLPNSFISKTEKQEKIFYNQIIHHKLFLPFYSSRFVIYLCLPTVIVLYTVCLKIKETLLQNTIRQLS